MFKRQLIAGILYAVTVAVVLPPQIARSEMTCTAVHHQAPADKTIGMRSRAEESIESGQPSDSEKMQDPTVRTDNEQAEEAFSVSDNDISGGTMASADGTAPEDIAADYRGEMAEADEKIDTEDLGISRLRTGSCFYLSTLRDRYGIIFSDDFSEVMGEIEAAFRNERGVFGDSSLHAVNWQSVIAVWVLEQRRAGTEGPYTLDGSCRDEISHIFSRMNEMISVDADAGTRVVYRVEGDAAAELHSISTEELLNIDDARVRADFSPDDRAILSKYTDRESLLLYTAVTHADGFIRENLRGLSNARVETVCAACSLVGRVGYRWGGKSVSIGEEPGWGNRTGGLDCSGFVSWSFLNGAAVSGDDTAAVGSGTTDQWNASFAVKESEALAGDLVFLQVPSVDSANHVGIVAGKTSAGELIVVHCNAAANGVAVEAADKAGFHYVRRPNCFKETDPERP